MLQRPIPTFMEGDEERRHFARMQTSTDTRGFPELSLADNASPAISRKPEKNRLYYRKVL